MTILAVDPGPEESAWVLYHNGVVLAHAKEANGTVLWMLGAGYKVETETSQILFGSGTSLVIEQIAAMGMAVGAEVFETVFWSGRFAQAWEERGGSACARVKRHEIKMHLCGNMRAKDPNIRQALIDRWGGKERAIGNKKKPGPLHGIAGDCWSALAIAVTWSETRAGPAPAAATAPPAAAPTGATCRSASQA